MVEIRLEKVDPITLEVIRHRLYQITEEMAVTIRHVSTSFVVASANDFNTGIMLPNGDLVTIGSYILIQISAQRFIVKTILERYQDNPGIEEGDMFVANDPYLGVPHQCDVALVAPFFYQGELTAWVGCTAHKMDIGAITPGIPSKVSEVFQEGLRMPPVKIVERGRLRRDLFDMILNQVREAPTFGFDIKAQIAANNVAANRLRELCDKRGPATVMSAMNQLLDFSEERFRQRLSELPDGTFRHQDRMDHDGHENRIYNLSLAMTKEKDSLKFDFTGTDPQAPGIGNSTYHGTYSGVLAALLPALCYDIPWNDGVLRAIEMNMPVGTIVNPVLAPVALGSTGASGLAKNAATITLSKLLACSDKFKDEVQACWCGGQSVPFLGGITQYGEFAVFIELDTLAGGGGATAIRDGMNTGDDTNSPTPIIPNIETYERCAPVLFLFRHQTPDSGGPGKFRGGVGLEWAFTLYDGDNWMCNFVSHGVEVPNAAGLFGGYPGATITFALKRDTNVWKLVEAGNIPLSFSDIVGETTFYPAKINDILVKKGDVMFNLVQGGGGYGDPLTRDPEKVLCDVQWNLVSPDWARETYGVVIRDGKVDQAATESQRHELRAKRCASKNVGGRHAAPPSLIRRGEWTAIAVQNGKRVIQCSGCGHVYCSADENPKLNAETREVPLVKASAYPPQAPKFVLRESICPGCGVVFEVEVTTPNAPPLWDIELRVAK